MSGRSAVMSGRDTAAAAVLLLAVTLVGIRPLAGFDTWWHLAAGRHIVETRALPSTDPFSFTIAGHEWVDHEWLWQLGAYGLFAAAGAGAREPSGGVADMLGGRPFVLAERDEREERAASALTVVNSLLLACGFLLGFETLRRAGAGTIPAAAIPLAAALGARVRFQARPEAAAMLLFAIAFFFLQRGRPASAASGESADPAKPDAGSFLPPIPLLLVAVVGANIHPSVLLLPALTALHVAGAGWEAARGPAGALRALPKAAAQAGLLAAATLANPYGAKLWLVPLRVGEVLQARSSFVPEWLPPSPADTPVFFVALALVIVLLVVAVRWKNGLAGLIPLVAIGTLATTGIRHTGLFLVVAPVAAAPLVCALLRRARMRAVGSVTAAAALLCPLSAMALERPARPALGVDGATTPVDACRFIALAEPKGPLYNDLLFGGYLDWRFAPARKTFIDGRMELFTPLLRELEGIHSGARPWSDWQSLRGRFGIEGALLRYARTLKGVLYTGENGGPPRAGWRAYSAYLFPENEWALVYWDDTAMLWLRKGGMNEGLIKRSAYEAVNPEDEAWQLEKAAGDPVFRGALQRDLERRSKEAPPSWRAEEMLRRLPPGLPGS